MAGGFGQIIGPTVAGALKDQYGFNWTVDIFSLSLVAFDIIYILTCGGFGSIFRSLRDTVLRCKKGSGVESDESKHKLLNEEDSEEDEEEKVSESFNKTKESIGDVDISTDTSLIVQNNGYTIN